MPKAGSVTTIRIEERQGKWYQSVYGTYADGSGGGILGRTLFGTSKSGATTIGSSGRKIDYKKINTKSRVQRTYNKDRSLLKTYRAMRFVNNPNALTLGGAIRGDSGIALGIASRVSSFVRTVGSAGANIYASATGETTRAENAKSFLGSVLRPSSFIIESTYGNWLRDMEVNRSNRGLEYHRYLTGQIVNTKDKGNYK